MPLILSIFGFVKNILTVIFTWCKENPKIFLGLVIILTAFFLGALVSRNHWQAPLKEKIAAYEEQEEKSKKLMLRISEDSIQDATNAGISILNTNVEIDRLSSLYEEEKKKLKTKTVVVTDGKSKYSIDFNERNEMICDRFSDAYTDRVNAMIKEANKQ